MIDGVIVPRPVTQFLLLALGAVVGELVWIYFDKEITVVISGLAGTLCMLCATAVWSMREKVDDALDPDYLDADQFRRSRAAHHSIRQRSMFHAALVALCALAAYVPVISKQLTGTFWHWMVVLAGLGVARAVYGYLLAAHWERQLRAHKESLIQAKKDREARLALESAIRNSPLTPGSFPGWTGVEGQLGHPPTRH